MKTIKVIIDFDENYGASTEAYLGCTSTAQTLREMKSNFHEAISLYFDDMRADGELCPPEGSYKLEFELTTAALLHHYKSIINLAALSKVTGINKALLSHYVTGYRKPRAKQRQRIIDGFHKIAEDLASVS